MITGLLNLATVACLFLAGISLLASIWFLLCNLFGKKTYKDDKGNEHLTYEDAKFCGGSCLFCLFLMVTCYILANGFNSPMEVSRMAQEKSIQENREKAERELKMAEEYQANQEKIQAEIYKQRILNAKNWCSKVKVILDSEEDKWNAFMNTDENYHMRNAYNFMRDYIDSFPDVPNDLPEEIQSDMREAVRLIQLVFKSRMAVIDSLNYMSRDRENWYANNEEIAEQTRIVYQDTKQEVEQIYYLLEEIRNKLE